MPDGNSHTIKDIIDILESTHPTPYDELPSIRNGKRIWRILSEARVGDIADVEIPRREAHRAESERKRDEDIENGRYVAMPIMPPRGGRPPPGFAGFPQCILDTWKME